MKIYITKIGFKIVRVTKKDYTDACCDDCGRELYPDNKQAFLWEGRLKGYLILCEKCISLFNPKI